MPETNGSKTKNWVGLRVFSTGNGGLTRFSKAIGADAARRIVQVAAVPKLDLKHVDYDGLAAKLSSDAEFARLVTSGFLSQTQGKEHARRAHLLEKIAGLATDLGAILDGPESEGLARQLGVHFPAREGAPRDPDKPGDCDDAPSWKGVRSAIRRLASSAEQAPVDPHEQFRKFTADTTPAQFLAGKLLRETYEKYLGRRPGSSRLKIPGEDYSDSGAKAGGPYIRFVAAAFRELGVVKSSGEAYGGETIVKALTQAKGGEK